MPTDPITPIPEPGPTTTEFWVSLLTTVLSLAVAVAELLQRNFDPKGLQSLVPAAGVLAAAATSAVYARSRATVKAAAHAASTLGPSLSTADAAIPASTGSAQSTSSAPTATAPMVPVEASPSSPAHVTSATQPTDVQEQQTLEALARLVARERSVGSNLPGPTPYNGAGVAR